MRLQPTLIATLLLLVISGNALAKLVIIGISTVEPHGRVTGFVSGMSPEELRDHKVLVYLHTDQWHIGPGTKAPPSKTFARIRPDGTWQLKTRRGRVKANRVGAIVVPMAYVPPAEVAGLADVPHVSITIRNVEGTPDDGKLSARASWTRAAPSSARAS